MHLGNNAKRVLIYLCFVVPFLLFAGCSTVHENRNSASLSPRRSDANASHNRSELARQEMASVALPAAGSGKGGYYQDDGPGENIPEDLWGVPDAQPKPEPYLSRANRSYVVFGKTYTPLSHNRPYKEKGTGSWYGKKFHGQKTSSGERYDMYKMTAAHPTLPIPSYARVTNLQNGRQIIVRINDRGPFLGNRIIDLSYTAALKLGYASHGTGSLEVERLLPEQIDQMAQAESRAAVPLRQLETKIELPAPSVVAVSTLPPDTASVSSLPEPALPPFFPAPAPVAAVVVPASRSSIFSFSSFYIQLGAYAQVLNAQITRMQLASTWPSDVPSPEVVATGIVLSGVQRAVFDAYRSGKCDESVAGV